MLEEVKSTHNLLRMENEGLKKEVQEMKGKILQLEKKEESREKEERKNNIIVTFKPDKASSKNKEDIQKCAKEVCKKIGEDDIDVERILFVKENRRGMTVVGMKIRDFQQKQKIMQNKFKLKGSETYIDNDLTKKEEYIQKQLRDLAKEKKRNGCQVKVGYNKLIINGKVQNWEELNKKPE